MIDNINQHKAINHLKGKATSTRMEDGRILWDRLLEDYNEVIQKTIIHKQK